MAITMECALNEIANAESLEELQPIINCIGLELGFSCSSYVDARKIPFSGEAAPYHVTTVDGSFIHAYIEGDFLGHDPVAIRATTSNAPFAWTDCPEYAAALTQRRGVKNRLLRLASMVRDFGYEQGYVIPCHAVDGYGRLASAFTSFYWDGRGDDLLKPGAIPPWLKLAAAYYHERTLALRQDAATPQAIPTLTDRERECLVWACRGKTRGETADILNIGERTVEFHLGNAMKKLGVYNKFHAIAMAIHMGLVTP